jgi:hypothetical protein
MVFSDGTEQRVADVASAWRSRGFPSRLFVCLLFNCAVSNGTTRLGDREINEYGANVEMRISMGNGSTRRKPAPVPITAKNDSVSCSHL